MKGQVKATALAAVALKPLYKTPLVWNSSSSSEAAGAGALPLVLGLPLRQLLLSGRTASSEQGFSVCLPHHFTPGL